MMNILLIHQYAGNKGDRAVTFAMCNLIKNIDPSIDITISTSSPDLWENETYYANNNIHFITNSWDFTEAHPKLYWRSLSKVQKYTFTILRSLFLNLGKNYICRFFINPLFKDALKKSDLVISVGGHHFTTLLSRDLVSSINYDAMSTLSFGKKLVCFSQSFGPFNFFNPQNEKLTKKILNNCSLLLPREDNASDSLIAMGVDRNRIKQTFESVISLNSLISEYTLPSNRSRIVGIAIYATQRREAETHKNYVTSIASACNYLINNRYEILFFPMELEGSGPDDRSLIKEIISNVSDPLKFLIHEDMTTKDHILKVSECQLFIGHKTHSTIFSMITGTPLVGIAYHIKTREFMRQFDCEEYCIDDENLAPDTIITKIEKILPKIDIIGKHLYERATEIRTIIESDMQLILGMK